MLRHVLGAGDALQLLDGRRIVSRRAVDEAQGKSILGGIGFFVAAVLLKKFAETVAGKGVVFLVVRAAGARQQHLRRLLRRHLRAELPGSSEKHEGKKTHLSKTKRWHSRLLLAGDWLDKFSTKYRSPRQRMMP